MRALGGVVLVLLGTVLGGGFAELTLALAPSYAGVFTSSLLFTLSGALGAALFMSAAMEAMAGRGKRVALQVFWAPVLAFILPGALIVARNDPAMQPGAMAGLLAGTFLGLCFAWAASRGTSERVFGAEVVGVPSVSQ